MQSHGTVACARAVVKAVVYMQNASHVSKQASTFLSGLNCPIITVKAKRP